MERKMECKIVPKRVWILAVGGVARFLILLPLLRVGSRSQAGLGMLVVFCLLFCAFTVWLEIRLWEEDVCFAPVIETGGRGAYVVTVFGSVCFFASQSSAFLYLCLYLIGRIWGLLRAGISAGLDVSTGILKAAETPIWTEVGAGISKAAETSVGTAGGTGISAVTDTVGALCLALALLPALTLVVANSLIRLRSLCARLWGELLKCEVPEQIRSLPNLFWWGGALFSLAAAAGYRDEYCAAGFYLAYNGQLLAAFAALLCVFCTVRKKYGKKDCRD